MVLGLRQQAAQCAQRFALSVLYGPESPFSDTPIAIVDALHASLEQKRHFG
jgi:hypothetical protein